MSDLPRKRPAPPKMTAEDVKVCNCADCGVELLGAMTKREEASYAKIPEKHLTNLPRVQVAGWVNDRPFCRICLFGAEKRNTFSHITPRQRGRNV